MRVTPIPDDRITIGKAVDTPNNTGDDPDVRGTIESLPELKPFQGKCPLWTYILAEAFWNKTTVEIPVTERNKVLTPQLGPVGGRIVAEVFLGMMFGDDDSLLRQDPNWRPTITNNGAFFLKDLVKYALGQ
jgi:hypothetical protein